MKVRDIISRDRVIFNMSYEDFIKWREDGYMTYLLESQSLHTKRINLSDHKSLENFISGVYDTWDNFTKQSILNTLRAITRYIQVEIGCIEYNVFMRDKNINKILNGNI